MNDKSNIYKYEFDTDLFPESIKEFPEAVEELKKSSFFFDIMQNSLLKATEPDEDIKASVYPRDLTEEALSEIKKELSDKSYNSLSVNILLMTKYHEIGEYDKRIRTKLFPNIYAYFTELMLESGKDTTTDERRKEIEKTINKSSSLMLIARSYYVGALAYDKEVLASERIKDNEIILKYGIDYSTDLENDGRGPFINRAAVIISKVKINPLEEYCQELKELESSVFQLNKSKFTFISRKPYQTEKRLEESTKDEGITLSHIPDYLPEPTAPGYKRTLKGWQNVTGKTENKAGLSHVLNDLVVLDTGKMINPSGKDVTALYIKMVKDGTIQTTPKDGALIYTLFSIAYAEYAENGIVPDTMHISVKELTQALYNVEERHSKKEEIVRRILDEKNTIGLLEGKGIFSYVTFEGLSEDGQTLSVSVPYAREALKSLEIDKKAIEAENKEYNKAHSRGKKPEEIAVVHKLNKIELNSPRNNKAAVAIVKELTQLIESAGFKKVSRHGKCWIEYKINTDNRNQQKPIIPHISVLELINRVPELDQALKQSTNERQTLQRTFQYVWQYLKEYTTVKEKWPGIVFPGVNMPETWENKEVKKSWIPTKKTMDKMIFNFRLLSKEEQTQNEQIQKQLKGEE